MFRRLYARRLRLAVFTATALGTALPLAAAVLPEDRFDALVHAYDGGGMEITGPSLLIRKLLNSNTSVSANYYVDSISSASIDVVTSASPYKERRTEYSVGVDYLRNKSTLSFNYTDSEERDYLAKTYAVGVSQDFFGDLTTLSMGYARGKDDVRRTTKNAAGEKILDAGFGTEQIDRHTFSLGLSQILSRNLVAGLDYDLITDKGYLNNPYRQVRFFNGTTVTTTSEHYPDTRSSNAVALQLKYHLPYRAAVSGKYRYFSDTWAIDAHTVELGYTHPLDNEWLLDLRLRHYSQNAASFYNDLFAGIAPPADADMLRARDKELSTFTNQTLGFTVSYDLGQRGWKYIDKGSVNFAFDYMMFDYEDFRDARVSADNPDIMAGEEPFYSFSSNVMQFYLSVWY